jgi:hypothetical protein
MMKRVLVLSVFLIAACSALAQEAWTGVVGASSNASCSAGEYFVYYNSTTGAMMKCENGSLMPIGVASSTSTVNGPVGSTYDPDRTPTSGTYGPCSDEFKNGASTGIWSWGNQSSATVTLAGDFAQLADTNDNTGTHSYVCQPDNSADWTMTAKFLAVAGGTTGDFGLVFIDGGSLASPTLVVGGVLRRTTKILGDYLVGTKAAWTTTAWTAVGSTNVDGIHWLTDNRIGFCVQARYVVATKVMTFRMSPNCRSWQWNATSTRTFTNHPGYAGFGFMVPASGTSQATLQWIRTRTDAAGTSGEYAVGE